MHESGTWLRACMHMLFAIFSGMCALVSVLDSLSFAGRCCCCSSFVCSYAFLLLHQKKHNKQHMRIDSEPTFRFFGGGGL